LARYPSNCFFARVASTAVSKEMIAVPIERPLRSYCRIIFFQCVDVGLRPKMGISVKRAERSRKIGFGSLKAEIR
jgi:hypothetical protein